MKKLFSVLAAMLCFAGAVWAAEGTLSAGALVSEFKENPIRFDKNYTGQPITTEGTVVTIEEKNGYYVLRIAETAQRYTAGEFIECVFEKSHQNTLLELNQGDTVTLKGTYSGKQESQTGMVMLSNCEILEKVSIKDRQEAAAVISNLRNAKAATLMFYADHMDGKREKLEAEINAPGSPEKLLAPYMDKPEVLKSMVLKTALIKGEKKWVVGMDVHEKPVSLRKILTERAVKVELINETGAPYSGEDIVFMVAR